MSDEAEKKEGDDANGTPKKGTTAMTRIREWKPLFLKHLAMMGNVGAAAKRAKVGYQTVYRERRSNPEFAKAWRVALRKAADVLEKEAWRRAVKGCEKPIYHAGEQVGSVQEYSDTLLIFMLKGTRPKKFRENIRHEHTGKNGGPIQYEDLSGLDTNELRTLDRLLAKIEATPAPSRN